MVQFLQCILAPVSYVARPFSVWSSSFFFRNRNRKLDIYTAPTKARNQLIHRRLSKTKSIGSGSDPERQTVRRLWWMVFGVETGREVCREKRTNQDRIC